MTITEARQGARWAHYYDVEWTLPDGAEIELDMLETRRMAVVEIRRDLAWRACPAAVARRPPRVTASFTRCG
jgi:hypothetical protein